MVTMTTLLPHGRPLTRSDLDALPDDGHRYELIDGALIVTPAPSYSHQDVVGELYVRLHAACTPGLKVMLAPFDVALATDTVMQPDLLVARREQFTARDLPGAPLLAVEVLSPSTRHIDLSLKRARFEEAGVTSYWVVDPLAPRITAWELVDGAYRSVAEVTGEETFSTDVPFPVTFRPAELHD